MTPLRTILAAHAFVLFTWIAASADAESIAPPADVSETTSRPRVVRITAAALRPRVPRTVDHDCDVHDLILGTRVLGKAHTSALSAVALAPSDHAAQFELKFTGRTVAKTVGHNGPVVIHSTTYTDFVVHKRVVLDDQGFHTLPAQVTTKTWTRLENIHTRRHGVLEPLVQRIAWREARRQLPQADRITDRNTSRRLAQSFDREVDDHVAEIASSGLFNSLELRQGMKCRPASYSTTDAYIQIVLHDTMSDMPVELASLPKHCGAPVEVFVPDGTLGQWQAALLGHLDDVQRIFLAALASHGTPSGALSAFGLSAIKDGQYLPLAVNRPGAWYLLTFGAPAVAPPRVALAAP